MGEWEWEWRLGPENQAIVFGALWENLVMIMRVHNGGQEEVKVRWVGSRVVVDLSNWRKGSSTHRPGVWGGWEWLKLLLALMQGLPKC